MLVGGPVLLGTVKNSVCSPDVSIVLSMLLFPGGDTTAGVIAQ